MAGSKGQDAGRGQPSEQPGQFDFLAGHLALDFVNTVANRLDPQRARELLATPGDLERWLREAGIAAHGKLKQADLHAALEVREQLHALFAALARGRPLEAAPLRGIDARLRDARASQALVIDAGRVASGWSAGATALQRAMLPLLSAAADLLQSDQAGRVRECEGSGCGWLFLDRSRGHPRRWCSMQDCGNRAKARRHYRKGQQEG